MAANQPERTGALVVRAWVQPGPDVHASLRARITYTTDLSAEKDEIIRVSATREQILDTVSEWIDKLTSSGEMAGNPQ